MPSSFYRKGDGTIIHIRYTGKEIKPCVYCHSPSSVLCDFPVSKNEKGKWETCDLPMCLDCTQKGNSKQVDFCRKHYPEALAAYERRNQKGNDDRTAELD